MFSLIIHFWGFFDENFMWYGCIFVQYLYFYFSQVSLYFFPLQEMKLSEPVPFYGRYINNIILTSAGGILIPPSSSSNDSLMMPSFIAPFLTSMPPSGKFSMFDILTKLYSRITYLLFPQCIRVIFRGDGMKLFSSSPLFFNLCSNLKKNF